MKEGIPIKQPGFHNRKCSLGMKKKQGSWMIPKQVVEAIWGGKKYNPKEFVASVVLFWGLDDGFLDGKTIFFGQTLDHLGKGHLWLDSWLAASKWIFCDFIFQGYTLSMICFICILTRHLYLWYGGYKKRSRSYSHHLPWSSNNVRVTLKLKYWALKSSSFLVAGPFLGEKRLYTWIC